jgi:hypothetical protein
MISNKFLAVVAALCALAVAPVALAAGHATATATPDHLKAGKHAELRVSGLNPGEKVKASELIADGGQKRTLYPGQRASASGVIIMTIRAQVKGRHTWTFTGRTSHRTAKTSYVVR